MMSSKATTRESVNKDFNNCSLLYFNARSLSNKLDMLNAIIKTDFYNFIFISETWLKEWHKTPTLLDTEHYSMYRRDRTGKRGGGVAILVKKSLDKNINLIPLKVETDF